MATQAIIPTKSRRSPRNRFSRTAGLDAPYPNPFNPRVTITYAPDRVGTTKVAIYDVQGRLVRVLEEGVFPEGQRTVAWDGTDSGGAQLASGAYIVDLRSGGTRDRRVVTLLK